MLILALLLPQSFTGGLQARSWALMQSILGIADTVSLAGSQLGQIKLHGAKLEGFQLEWNRKLAFKLIAQMDFKDGNRPSCTLTVDYSRQVGSHTSTRVNVGTDSQEVNQKLDLAGLSARIEDSLSTLLAPGSQVEQQGDKVRLLVDDNKQEL